MQPIRWGLEGQDHAGIGGKELEKLTGSGTELAPVLQGYRSTGQEAATDMDFTRQ